MPPRGARRMPTLAWHPITLRQGAGVIEDSRSQTKRAEL
jgi:hypothetical protein